MAITLGHLARSSTIPNTDYVEFEVSKRSEGWMCVVRLSPGTVGVGAERGVWVVVQVTRALEWLLSEQGPRRLAACLVLKVRMVLRQPLIEPKLM